MLLLCAQLAAVAAFIIAIPLITVVVVVQVAIITTMTTSIYMAQQLNPRLPDQLDYREARK